MYLSYIGTERIGISVLFGSKNAVPCDIMMGGQVQSMFCYVCGSIYTTDYDAYHVNINPPPALQVLRCYAPPSYLESGVGRVPLKVVIALTLVLYIYVLTQCIQNRSKTKWWKETALIMCSLTSLFTSPIINSFCMYGGITT